MSSAALEGFTQLSSTISIHRPRAAVARADNKAVSPALVVICSWMGAGLKYIAKYSQGYQDLLPDATILLVQCSVSDVFQSSQAAKRKLATVCEIVMSAYKEDADRQIILHAFSNGGATMATHLAYSLREKMPESSAHLPFTAYIFDCFPGKPNMEEAVRAFTISLPQPGRTLAALLLRVVLFCMMIIHRTFRVEDVLTKLRRRLNDPSLYDAHVPRLYMYSKADALVGFRAVREHIVDAADRGFKVIKEEAFETAPHCALPREDGQRYWTAVKNHINQKSDGINL